MNFLKDGVDLAANEIQVPRSRGSLKAEDAYLKGLDELELDITLGEGRCSAVA